LGGLLKLWNDSVFLCVTDFNRPDSWKNVDETNGIGLYGCDPVAGSCEHKNENLAQVYALFTVLKETAKDEN
jgi:hypothetical protein